MALSNIFREPRREITESVIGLLTLALFLTPAIPIAYLDVWLTNHGWWGPVHDSSDWWFVAIFGPLVVVMLTGLVTFLSVLFFVGTHALGDWACDALLMNTGWDPRPKQRYR